MSGWSSRLGIQRWRLLIRRFQSTLPPPSGNASSGKGFSPSTVSPADLFKGLLKPSRGSTTRLNNKPESESSSALLESLQSFGLGKVMPKYHTLFIQSTRNNTIATFSDHTGKVITTSSAGACGLRNAAKSTSDAGYLTIMELVKKALAKKANPMNGVHVKLKGFGAGREQAFRAVVASGWEIKRITDVTSYRHAGCRPPKQRRL